MTFFSHHNTKDLVAYYNEIAPQLGRKPVTKFENRETAERRCDEVRLAIAAQRADADEEGVVTERTLNWPYIKRTKVTPQVEAIPGMTQLGLPPEPEAPNYAKADDGDDVVVGPTRADFKTVRVGSNREKMVELLCANFNQFVTLQALVAGVYGEDVPYEEYKGAVQMVLKGFTKDLDRNKIAARLERSKIGKVVSFGLMGT